MSSNRNNISLNIKSFDIDKEEPKISHNNSLTLKIQRIDVSEFEEEKTDYLNLNKRPKATNLNEFTLEKNPYKEEKESESSNEKMPNNVNTNQNNGQINATERNKIANNDDDEKMEMNEYCLVCDNKLKKEELDNNFIECFHGFCDSCYNDYLKEKIINNDVENIKCLQKGCNTILYDHFIQNHLKDISLLEKYIKFKQRKQLAKDPNIQLCPYPNCESYANKNEKSLFVTCLKGHKFCFNCLKDWHKNEKCKIEEDEKFDNWKKSKRVKRCPNCKYFIEKNEGCNHMTCRNCKYEWCWICEQESLPGHYDPGGQCEGLQYSNCPCLSNQFCLVLYKFLLHILECLKLFCMFPAAFYMALFKLIKEINYNYDFFLFKALISFYICLCFFVYGTCIMLIILIIMIFCFPFKRFIIEKFDDLLD
jgi:hypothetical protein